MSFNTINHLFFEKKKPELDAELLENFSPYLTSRALTFVEKSMVPYVNDTLNVYAKVFPIKEDQFRFFENMIPKMKKRRYEYIKRPKVETPVEELSIPEFYCKRELDYLKSKCK